MIYIVVLLIALSVALLVVGVGQMVVSGESRTLRRRLATVSQVGQEDRRIRQRRERMARRDQLQGFLEAVGEKVGKEQIRRGGLRETLIHAGYRKPAAPAMFVGVRALVAVTLGTLAFLTVSVLRVDFALSMLVVTSGVLVGWMAPILYLRHKVRTRKKELRRALPDALDLMVVCVEAGLGLNQALVRVGDEMERVSQEVADEFTLVSLEIRAGTPREDALRHLGDRTGTSDVRALVSMLIQTDRFGTSIADALRVHAEELRSKRQQEAEEQAAKITVKMLIPMVIFVVPAIFVVILGPAVFHFLEFSQMQ
ncbi:MAG: type II secretion system F family protein [Gemmatimonadota bacterium]